MNTPAGYIEFEEWLAEARNIDPETAEVRWKHDNTGIPTVSILFRRKKSVEYITRAIRAATFGSLVAICRKRR